MPAGDPVFLDTSGWVALISRHDDHHDLASRLWQEYARARRTVVTTDWVLAETGNSLSRTVGRSVFPEAVRAFYRSGELSLDRHR